MIRNRSLRRILYAFLAVVTLLSLMDLFFVRPSFANFLIEESKDDAIRIARHLTSMYLSDITKITEESLSESFLSFIEEEMRDFNIKKLNIFSASGQIIYSTDPDEIGTINQESFFHEIVSKGNSLALLLEMGDKTHDGNETLFDVVETYVPIMHAEKFVGAFEIYYDVSLRLQELNKAVIEASSVRLGILVLFFIVIVVIFYERKRSEEILRESEERFRSVAQFAPDAFIIADRGGIILFWNQAASKMFGYPKEEILGRAITLVIPERHGMPHQEGMKRFLATGEGRAVGKTIELTGLKREGTEFPIGLSLTSWKTGDTVFFGAIIRDLTQAHRAQDQTVARERLAAVGQLAAGIAHDFNNILVPISLYAELLLSDSTDPSKNRERLKTILGQANHAASLTRQILDFSRRSVLELEVMDLAPFLKEFANLLHRTLPENIRLELDHKKGEIFTLRADPTRLQQVFMNLALNARDTMLEGGELRLELSRLQFEPNESPPYRDMPSGEWVCVEVTDTGEGILPKHLPHIFEPFYTTKEVGKGSGMGLSQVYGIVKQHNGYIDVRSRAGEGTTFTLYLPAVPVEEAKGIIEGTTSPLWGGGETVLVVEDDEEVQKALCEILETLNYKTLKSTSGNEALEIYERETIDLVLSDLVMPQLGGVALYDALRDRNPKVKLVVITGYPIEEEGRDLLERGIVGWVQKPLSIEKIAQTVSAALGNPTEGNPSRAR